MDGNSKIDDGMTPDYQKVPFLAMDMDKLRKRYFQLQKQCHPDKSASSSSETFEISTSCNFAEAQSCWLNKGYSTLKDPVQRAKYFYELLTGNEILSGNDDDASVTMGNDMFEIFEMRERVEDASSITDIDSVVDDCRHQLHETMVDIQRRFDELSSKSSNSESELQEKLRQSIIKLKYFSEIEKTATERYMAV